jgi:ubiquinone/menaquinone biosynthesis C-methylase UbiE
MSAVASRFVGSIPENYDRYLGPLIFEGYAADLAQRLAKANPKRLLELAAGTGIVTRRCRDLLRTECEIVATDLNEPMLEIAKKRFDSRDSVTFDQADATDLPFADGSFDAVSCQFGVMFFPDKNRGYTEVLRVLRSGGTYIFNVWDSWRTNPFADIVHGVVEKLFPDDPPGFYKVPFHYHDTDVIRRDVLSAGFSDVNIERISTSSKIPSAADFATGLVFGNPLIEEILSRGGDPLAACDSIAEAIDAKLGAQMPLCALIVEAKKT